MIHIMTCSTHFNYGYMASDMWITMRRMERGNPFQSNKGPPSPINSMESLIYVSMYVGRYDVLRTYACMYMYMYV